MLRGCLSLLFFYSVLIIKDPFGVLTHFQSVIPTTKYNTIVQLIIFFIYFYTLSDKPIIQLFKRLITTDNKQSTVLTNAQIVDILNKEFDIQISKLHELESDIYLTIMKKFLKDWPQWDEFDKVINKLKLNGDNAGVDKLLQKNYVNLKKYLRDILNYAQDIIQKTVQAAIDEDNAKKLVRDESIKDNSMVVLEICASRNQLNQLFYRQPQSGLNNTVFNSEYSIPTQISLNTLPLEAILNWWDISISITSNINKKGKVLLYLRETKHRTEHMLVNKKINSGSPTPETLPQDLRIKNALPTPKIDRYRFTQFVFNMTNKFANCSEILEFIKKDLELLPDTLYSRQWYQRYMNKYPYVRYLYKNSEVKADCEYDLQLREVVSPQYATYIGRIEIINKTLTVKCNTCKISFVGDSLVQDLRNHFTENHMLEPNFKCTNCKKDFTMAHLAQHWWTHRC